MAVLATDIQRIIVLRVGDIDPATGDPPVQGGAGMVASNITTLWSAYSDKALVAPRLQELYTQRDACDLIIALLRHQVDTTQGDPSLSVRLNQRVATAMAQRKATQDEIVIVETRAQKARGGAVGQITQREPVSPSDAVKEIFRTNPWFPDASDSRFSGSPYAPRRVGRW